MYNLFYKLTDRPFSKKPDLKYFYPTHAHKRAHMHLRVGLEQSDGVLTLTGEKGSGKTTLMGFMLEQLDKNSNVVVYIKSPPLKYQDFLMEILAKLQISTTEHEPQQVFNTLHKFLIEQVKQSKKIRLVINEAEKLSSGCFEIVRLLSTIRLNERGLLQIILVGTNNLDTMLAANENNLFRQQISVSYCIPPLQITDTQEYIEHRLKVAGWQGDPVVAPDTYAAIHKLTGGIPEKINRYCDRLLMLGMLQEKHHISAKEVASLTPETMEKLDKFEATQMDQLKQKVSPQANVEKSFSQHTEQNTRVANQHASKEFEVDEIMSAAANTKSKNSTGKKRIVPIITAYAVSFLAVIVFYDMYEKKTANSHSPANDHLVEEQAHSSIDAHAASADHGSDTTNGHDSATNESSAHAHNVSTSKNNVLSLGYLAQNTIDVAANSHDNQHDQGSNHSSGHASSTTETKTLNSVFKSLSTYEQPSKSFATLPATSTQSTSHSQSNAAGGTCEGFGPQTPRDIDNVFGSNKRTFTLAPPSDQLNLCNIHFHNNAEHKAMDFSIYAGDGDHGHGGGYQCGMSKTLSASELSPPSGDICNGLKPGDTIEVHWVHTSCDIKPGKGLGSCVSDSCANPDLRVETQVFTLVNDPSALNFNDFAYQGNMSNGLYQAKALPVGTGIPVQFTGSTTGPKYSEQSCSPYQVTWSVRPKCAKVDINSVGQWCKSNAFEEDHAHGVRKLVTNPALLSRIN